MYWGYRYCYVVFDECCEERINRYFKKKVTETKSVQTDTPFKWFLSGFVIVFTCPSLLYSTLLVILASPEGMPNSLGILGRGCLDYGDAKITVTPP